MFTYNLIRSRRRTLAVHIVNGEIEVRAPLRMPKHEIDNFLASKEKLISGRLVESRMAFEQRAAFAINYDDTVIYRGAEYPVTAAEGNRAGFDGERFFLPPALTAGQIKDVIIKLYRRLARQVINGRAAHYAELMGITPSAVKISGAKTRWGSCSAQKSLNFSWRLIMADDAVIDYVVVHELAHIKEMNHSARFWALVSGVLPDYRDCRARLRDLQKRLDSEGWE